MRPLMWACTLGLGFAAAGILASDTVGSNRQTETKVALQDTKNKEDDLQQLIRKDIAERIGSSSREIHEVCEKYRVDLISKVVIVGDKVGGEIIIVPRAN